MFGICKRALLSAAFAGVMALAQGGDAGSPDFFETKVRPVLANNCFSCHTNTAMGGLRLDSPEALHKGGKRGMAEESRPTAFRRSATSDLIEDRVRAGAPVPP